MTKYGVYVGPRFPGTMSDREIFDYCLDTARVARASGFDGIFVGHHYALGPTMVALQPLVLLARLAAEIPGAHLGTAVFLLPLHHPLHVAESTAFLDIACGGRFVLGVGQGYRPAEFEAFGVPIRERAQLLVEGAAAVKTLWESDPADFDGKFYRFANITVRPRPLQKPRPPIWVGADNMATVIRTLDIGDAWMVSGRHDATFIRSVLPEYRRRLDVLARPYTGLPMFRELHVAYGQHRAVENFERIVEQMRTLEGPDAYLRGGFERPLDELRQERLILGDPSEVAEQVDLYRREFSVPFMWFRVYWPGMDPMLALETIQLLGHDVLSQLRG
jgi:alkanesulfonate monooxygenase SsuD/methylene tetrahydromethanopterin reductase-like flavin-dependent oxidoreductase (luciferase family)